MNALETLHDTGQRLWLDNITKHLISSGTLAHYIDDLYVTGVTSNPTILEKAISGGSDYDSAIAAALAADIESPQDLVFAVALQDLVAAADLLRPIFDASDGTDGFVSVEVAPDLVDDAGATVAAGLALFAQADRPNVLVKVPGTTAGLSAIEDLIAAGVPVNVTLLFSTAHYQAAADAYLRGLERRLADGLPLTVASVASLFVSRWDAAVDPAVPPAQQGKTAIAVMSQTLARHHEIVDSDRWQALAAAGASAQKPLWASTGTKNPELSDTYYLGRLAAPGTVNTIPEATLLAFAEYGAVCELLDPDVAGAEAMLADVAAEGVDIDALATTLQVDGATAFRASWSALLACMQRKVDHLRAAHDSETAR